MKIYQLCARGDLGAVDGPNKIYSKRVFKTYEGAEKYQDEFKHICMTPKNDYDLSWLEKIHSINILELELQEV